MKLMQVEVFWDVTLRRWGYSWRRFEIYLCMDCLTENFKLLLPFATSGTLKPDDTKDLNLQEYRHEHFRFRKTDIGKRLLTSIDTYYKN